MFRNIQRHCGLARHFKTDPTETVALCLDTRRHLADELMAAVFPNRWTGQVIFAGSCPALARLLPGSCPALTRLLPGSNPDLAQLLPGSWLALAQLLPSSCPALSRLFPGSCPALARLLPGSCPAIAQLLPGYCPALARLISIIKLIFVFNFVSRLKSPSTLTYKSTLLWWSSN
jgi:hypothetical protein